MPIGVFVCGGAIRLRGLVVRVGVTCGSALSLVYLLPRGPGAVGCVGSLVLLSVPPRLRRLCFLVLAHAINPPAEAGELVVTWVVAVNIPFLPEDKIPQSAIKMKMEPDAPAGLPSSHPIRLDLAEVLGEPALEAFVR